MAASSGIERQPRKKLEPSPERLLALLHRWRDEAVRAGRTITRIAVAFEAGRDGFWLARWLEARGVDSSGLFGAGCGRPGRGLSRPTWCPVKGSSASLPQSGSATVVRQRFFGIPATDTDMADAPRPDDILLVMAIADGGRLLNRCGTEPVRLKTKAASGTRTRVVAPGFLHLMRSETGPEKTRAPRPF